MDRYTISGLKLVRDYSTENRASQEELWHLIEAVDCVLYEQFDKALLQNGTAFQMVLNGVELECRYTLVEKELRYTATRLDNQKQEYYQFQVDIDEVYDSILSDDITQARLVSLWVVAGYRF